MARPRSSPPSLALPLLLTFLLCTALPTAADGGGHPATRPTSLERHGDIFDSSESASTTSSTNPARGRRTIDVLLQGLAEALGYELRPRAKVNATAKASTTTTAAPPKAIPKAPPLAPRPPPPATRPPAAEPITPKGANASDVDLLAQKEEDEDDGVEEYVRDTAGEYFRKEYDRIRAGERNPPWGTGYYEEDDKDKPSVPIKRDEEADDNYYQYYFPAYSGAASGSEELPKYSIGDGDGGGEPTTHALSATSEGPYYIFGSPVSYSFNLPYNPRPADEREHETQRQPEQASEEDSRGIAGPRETASGTSHLRNDVESLDHPHEETDPSSAPVLSQGLVAPPPPGDPKVRSSFKASYAGQLPIASTFKPRMAQILQEMEGANQDSLWPPPFDYAFDSTDSSPVAEKPAAVVQQNSVLAEKSAQLVEGPTRWPQAGYHPGEKVLSLVAPQPAPPFATARRPDESAQSPQVQSVVQNALKWIASQSDKAPSKIQAELTRPSPSSQGFNHANLVPSALKVASTPHPPRETQAIFNIGPSPRPAAGKGPSLHDPLSWFRPTPASRPKTRPLQQQKQAGQPPTETKTTNTQVGAYVGLVVPNPLFSKAASSSPYGIVQASNLLTASPTSPGEIKAASPEKEYEYSQHIEVPRPSDYSTTPPPVRSQTGQPIPQVVYVSSTTEPSFYRSQPLIVSSPKPFTREYPSNSNNALYFQSDSDERTGTHKPYPYYQTEQQVSVTTIKPYIPPADHYGIRLPPSTTTTSTTTPIPPRSQSASEPHRQRSNAAPPTNHYGIRLPPPPPPPPPQRRLRQRLSPEELARRHHEEFLRHPHPDDYDLRPYEEYPEIAGARYLYADDDEEQLDEDLLDALRAQNEEVSELNSSFQRLSDTLHPRQDVQEKIDAIQYTLAKLLTNHEQPKEPEETTKTTEILEILKGMSSQLQVLPEMSVTREDIMNKMADLSQETAAILRETSSMTKHAREMKESLHSHRGSVESCVADLTKRTKELETRTVLPTQARRGDAAEPSPSGESVTNQLEEIRSCLSHLMEEATTKDALLLDQNAQVLEIHGVVSQLLERAPERSRSGEDLVAIAATLTQLLAKLKIWDSLIRGQQEALEGLRGNMASAGEKMAAELITLWESQKTLQSEIRRLSEGVALAFAAQTDSEKHLESRILTPLEHRLRKSLADPLSKNRSLIETVLDNIETLSSRIEVKRTDDVADIVDLSSTVELIKEEIALIQASTTEMLSKFEVITNTIDIDSLEFKSQLSDVHNNILVLKKLQVDCTTGLRKQISDFKPYEFGRELELIFSSLDKLYKLLLTLSEDTYKSEKDHVRSVFSDMKATHEAFLNELNEKISVFSEAMETRDAHKDVRPELARIYSSVQRLPELVSLAYDISFKKELGEFRGQLNDSLESIKEIVQSKESRWPDDVEGGGAERSEGSRGPGGVVTARGATMDVSSLKPVTGADSGHARSSAPGAVRPAESWLGVDTMDTVEGVDGAAAAAATAVTVLMAAHLAEETRRRQGAEAVLEEAGRRLEALEAGCRRQLEAARALERTPRRRPGARRAFRQRVSSSEEHRTAIRRLGTELHRASATSSAEKLAATRRRLRRLRAALRRLEQLSASMEGHYQNMLQELGHWVLKAAHLLEAPKPLQTLAFPTVPSHIGSWFLQTCSVAEWVVSHLQAGQQIRQLPPELEKEEAAADRNHTMEKQETSSVSVIIHEEHDRVSENDTTDKIEVTNTPTTNQRFSRSLILATLQESSTFKTQNVAEQKTIIVNTHLGESSSNGSQSKTKHLQKMELASHSNESDMKTASEVSRKTFPTVRERQKSPIIKKPQSAIPSSEELSLSVGSLDSVFSVAESSDTANIQASSLSDDVKTPRKADDMLMEQKVAEDKLIAILDNLKEKLLNADPSSSSSRK